MPNERRHGMPDLPDAEIEKYLPPGVPLEWPTEQLTGTDQACARLHRTMIVGHARICAALDVVLESRRQAAAAWAQCMAALDEALNRRSH